jgi:hypothetical protein
MITRPFGRSTPDFGERLEMVVDEVDHVDQEDDVEDLAAERQRHRVGARQPRLRRQQGVGDQLLAKRAEHGRREIDAAVAVARTDERQCNTSVPTPISRKRVPGRVPTRSRMASRTCSATPSGSALLAS